MKKVIPEDAVLVPANAELAFKGVIYDVYQWSQTMFDGSQAPFEMLKRADTIVVLAVIDSRIVVLDEEQPHSGRRRSFPSGRVDTSDQTTLAAAKREIKEETGYSFNSWKLVEVSQPYRKIEWFTNIFLAWDETGEDKPHLDPGEKISAKLLDFNEVKELVMTDQDYLGKSRNLFMGVNSINQLLNLPEFSGQLVDR
jgi:ADP-ribose pyrophosphatase